MRKKEDKNQKKNDKSLFPRNKYLILDTCVLTKLADAYFNKENPHPWASHFYDTLQQNGVDIIVSELVIFEYTRGANSYKQYSKKIEFLSSIVKYYLGDMESRDIMDTIIISNIYKNKGLQRDPSFVDLHLAAILRHLPSDRALLATFNYHDFPLFFLDREIVMPIDMQNKIENLCFYKFNETRFNSCFSDLKRDKRNT